MLQSSILEAAWFILHPAILYVRIQRHIRGRSKCLPSSQRGLFYTSGCLYSHAHPACPRQASLSIDALQSPPTRTWAGASDFFKNFKPPIRLPQMSKYDFLVKLWFERGLTRPNNILKIDYWDPVKMVSDVKLFKYSVGIQCCGANNCLITLYKYSCFNIIWIITCLRHHCKIVLGLHLMGNQTFNPPGWVTLFNCIHSLTSTKFINNRQRQYQIRRIHHNKYCRNEPKCKASFISFSNPFLKRQSSSQRFFEYSPFSGQKMEILSAGKQSSSSFCSYHCVCEEFGANHNFGGDDLVSKMRTDNWQKLSWIPEMK